MRTLTLHSPEETQALGVRLGRVLGPGDFVGLVGALGAGKTHFVRGVAEGAGVDPAIVASPTYAIVTTYPGARLTLHHADLYRLRDAAELEATGFHDLDDGFTAMLVEWIDQIPGAAPRDHLRLTFRHEGPEARTLEIEPRGPRAARLVEAWVGA
jgi:tRNA threonylcarbamoyladenosine biosynthesis protein TsaE